MPEPTILDYLGGDEALHRLAAAQYRRCLTDPVLTSYRKPQEDTE